MALRDVLRGLGLEALDDTTVDYLVDAAAECESTDDLQELLAPFLEDHPEHLATALSAASSHHHHHHHNFASDKKTSEEDNAPLTALSAPVSLAGAAAAAQDGGEAGPTTGKGSPKSKQRSPPRENKKQAARREKGSKSKARQSDGAGERKGLVEVTSKLSRFATEFTEQTFTGIDMPGVCITIDGRLLLEGDLQLKRGRRYGLVGQNGCGKSTLLRCMAEKRIPGWPQSLRVLLVEQEDIGDKRSAVETVLSAHSEVALLRVKERILASAAVRGAEACHAALLELAVADVAEELRLAQLLSIRTSRQRGKIADAALVQKEKEHEAAVEQWRAASGGDEADQLQVTRMLAEVHESLAARNADGLEANARSLLAGLGFKKAEMDAPTSSLSGGWRMRVAIARALVSDVQVLLLDEPTNHLDWPGLLFLEEYLTTLGDIVLLVVSHDRAFLDTVATDIVRLAGKTFQYFHGNYSHYEDALEKERIDRANYAAQMKAKVDAQWEKVRRLEAEGRKSNDAKKLNQVASMKKKLGVGTSHGISRVGMTRGVDGKKFSIFTQFDPSTLDTGEKQVIEDDTTSWKFVAAEPLDEIGALQCRQVQFGYPGRPLSQCFDLDVGTSKIAILGANGTGKSTFLRTLAGEIEPLQGTVQRSRRLVLAYFAQHVTDSLNTELTPVQILQEKFPDATPNEIRGHLGSILAHDFVNRFSRNMVTYAFTHGLTHDLRSLLPPRYSFGVRSIATTPLKLLSGGEKTRCSLATVTFKPPHVLLLDEPTNHLDINTVAALSEALKGFTGGLVLVSHDRRLIEQLGCATMMLHQGELHPCTLQDFLVAMRKS